MKKGFYTIMAAQFFSSLADNALLIAAIALLKDLHAPNWMTPLLKLFFVLSYVVLAAFVGAFADSRPKGHVMFVTNSIKVVGCLTMLFGAHPLLAYGIVGFGAAAYSPAKYGILTELLPADRLVAANGWIEGTTVGSIILGTVHGRRAHQSAYRRASCCSLHIPRINTPAEAAMLVIVLMYVVAAIFNLRIPDTGARYPKQETRPLKLITDFADCFSTLWRDKLGQISLAVTTLFWGAGATLQFIVLKWAEVSLGMTLSQAAILQAVIAVGVAVGAVLAAARVPLKRSLSRAAGRHHDGHRRHAAGVLHAAPLSRALGHLLRQDARPRLSARRVSVPDDRRRPVGLLRRADERAAAASRPRADVAPATRSPCRTSTRTSRCSSCCACTPCSCGSTCRSSSSSCCSARSSA